MKNRKHGMYTKLRKSLGINAGPQTQKSKIEIWNEKDKIEATFQDMAAKDFMCFVRGINIKSDDGPKMFDSCIAMYQRKCFEELTDSLHDLKKGKKPKKRRFWIERTKKAGKDSDLAVCILWLVAFAERPFYLEVGAADRKQAAIVKDRVSDLLHINPWLNDYVNLVQWELRSRKEKEDGQPLAKLRIMSSEIAGAHGGTPDLLIINELSHVTKWEFVENLMDNADGVPNGMVIIATNAGFIGSKAELWRSNAIASSEWTFHKWDRPAPWISKEMLEDAENRTKYYPSRFKRLWYGKWVSGKGDALDEDDIARCFCLNENEYPLSGPEDGWTYVAGLDLGISHDHSALCVLGLNENKQVIKTVWWKRWIPPKKGDIDLIKVEEACVRMSKLFRISFLFFDPYQAKLMGQRLRKQRVPAVEMPFKNVNLDIMATNLLQVIESGNLQCYDDINHTLRQDFGKFSIVEKSYGHKLEAVSDEFGHADVATALVICLPFAVDMLEGSRGLLPDDDLIIEDEEKLSEEEFDEMPQEFKELYDMYDKLEEEQKDFNWNDF